MPTNSERPLSMMEQFENESELNREIISAMRSNPKTAPMMQIWDYLKHEQARRTEWIRNER